MECLLDDLVLAGEQQVGAFLQHVGDHQDNNGEALLVQAALHEVDELLLALHDAGGVDDSDLTNSQVVAGDVELLVVGVQQLLGSLVAGGGGEDGLAQLVNGLVGDSCHTLCHDLVTLGAGGGLEHDGIGQDGGSHQACHAGGGQQPTLLEHTGDDGIGGTHGLVADVDGVVGLDISQTVVVDDGHDLSLSQAGNGLGGLVVVDQNNALAAGTQQVVTGDDANNLLLLVQDGEDVVTLGQLVLDVIQAVLQMQADDALGQAHLMDGDGLEQQHGSTACIIGGGDDAGLGLHLAQVLGQLGLAQDQGLDVLLQGTAHHVGLVAAEDDGLGLGEQQVLAALGHGDADLTGDGIHVLTGIVEDAAFQNGQNIEQRNLFQNAGEDLGHVVVCHLVTGQDAVEGAVFVGDGQGTDELLLIQGLPGLADGDSLAQDGGRVVVQILDLGVHAADDHRGFKAEAVQDGLGLVRDTAQGGGPVFSVAHCVLQGSIGHCADDGVGVRVTMASYIDGVHIFYLPIFFRGLLT